MKISNYRSLKTSVLLLTLIFLGLVSNTFLIAQDSAYYQPAFNSSDSVLKAHLNQIIKNHSEYTYTSSSTDVWDILKETDKDTNNSDNVILIYSGRSVDAAQEYNSASGWSREHVWAKSRGDFGTDEGAGTDVHHLRPCDVSVNSSRNNRNFDTCFACVDVIDNGFNTGSKRDANLWTFEPPDAVKGDVARMIFYMAVRYEGDGQEPDLELTNTLLSNTDKSPLQARLTTLLHWNRIDTVSQWERNRNNIIDSVYQHNRNPFIDNPELAEYLWGDSVGVIWKPLPTDTSTNTGINTFELKEIKIYPNPTSSMVMLEGDIETVTVFNSYGQLLPIPKITKNNLDFSSAPNGLYFVHIVQSNQQSKVIKLIKN